MIAFYSTILALFITIALVPLLIRWAEPLGLMDAPGARKIHREAVPRVGGIAIAVGALTSVLVWLPLRPEIAGYLAGASVTALFGVLDDRFNLDYRLKFAGQIAAALLFVGISGVQLTRAPFVYGGVMPDWFGLPLTLVVLVGVTNAVNLSDGMDGLAGSTSLVAAGTLGYLAYLGGDKQIALVALCLIGATFGFLRYNTFPARVFMGDSGSQFLGFSVAALAIVLIERSNTAISPLVPLLVLGLPIIDTLSVMVRRLQAGGSPFAPDRRHLHHRLLDGGLSQYEALLLVYALYAVLIGLAWWLRFAPDAVLLVAFLAFGAALLLSLYKWQRRRTEGRALVRRLAAIDRLVDYLRAEDILKRIGHHGVVYGVALLLPAVALGAARVTPDVGWLALLVGLMLLLALVPGRLLPRFTIYRLAAFAVSVLVVYLAESGGLRGLATAHWLRGYLLLVAACVALWLRFGAGGEFRLNALDVLVILLVAIVPNMPVVRELGIGAMVIEVLLLFYACELILSERPARWGVFRLALLGTLAILAVRGIAPPGFLS